MEREEGKHPHFGLISTLQVTEDDEDDEDDAAPASLVPALLALASLETSRRPLVRRCPTVVPFSSVEMRSPILRLDRARWISRDASVWFMDATTEADKIRGRGASTYWRPRSGPQTLSLNAFERSGGSSKERLRLGTRTTCVASCWNTTCALPSDM